MSEERQPGQGGEYEIRVKGHLGERWSRLFEGMVLSPLPDGTTRLVGAVDQAALQGVLSRIGDLGLELLLVMKLDAGENGRLAQERA